MTLMKGRTRNTNDEADVPSAIATNSSTSVVIAAANPDRLFFRVCMDRGTNNRDVWVRLYPSSQDNLKRGICIGRRLDEDGSYDRMDWEMPVDNIYTGEISAICESSSEIGPLRIKKDPATANTLYLKPSAALPKDSERALVSLDS